MNSPHIIATTAFLLLLAQFNSPDAAGPYDGEWTGTATSTGERCKPAVVSPDHAPRTPFLHVRAAHARRRPVRSDRFAATHSATRLGLICLSRRRIGAQRPAAHPLDGARRSATARNSRPSGQLVGSWIRMRARCSITRAPILIR